MIEGHEAAASSATFPTTGRTCARLSWTFMVRHQRAAHQQIDMRNWPIRWSPVIESHSSLASSSDPDCGRSKSGRAGDDPIVDVKLFGSVSEKPLLARLRAIDAATSLNDH